MDDRRRRLDRNQRGTRSSTDDRSRPRSADASRGMSELPSRPWQRPPQFQHGHHDNAFGDAETTGALLARLAAARDREDQPASPAWQRPQLDTPVGVPFDWPDAAAVAYLGLLDSVLDDRVITDAEVGRLREFATDWGIGGLEAECLHRGYVARAWELACADATVTPAELRDIENLAELLGVPVEVRHRNARGAAGARWVVVPVEADTVAVGPRSRSAPVPSREVVGQRTAAGQSDAATARLSRAHKRR